MLPDPEHQQPDVERQSPAGTYKPYTGIGSRETPPHFLEIIRSTSTTLANLGFTLRSGAAPKADTAFEEAADGLGPIELYLPWPRFEGRIRHVRLARPTPAAYEVAAQTHPAWHSLSQGARALHARNVHQVVGPHVAEPEPSLVVICWTPGGHGGGGTGQAVRVAAKYGVPVIDLGNPLAQIELARYLGST